MCARSTESSGLAARIRLKARLQYADMAEIQAGGASVFVASVLDECAAIHRALYEAYVAYPLELRLPA